MTTTACNCCPWCNREFQGTNAKCNLKAHLSGKCCVVVPGDVGTFYVLPDRSGNKVSNPGHFRPVETDSDRLVDEKQRRDYAAFVVAESVWMNTHYPPPAPRMPKQTKASSSAAVSSLPPAMNALVLQQ